MISPFATYLYARFSFTTENPKKNEKYFLSSDISFHVPVQYNYIIYVLAIQQTRYVGPVLVWCWPTVYDAGPTSNQHRSNVSCLLGGRVRRFYKIVVCGLEQSTIYLPSYFCSFKAYIKSLYIHWSLSMALYFPLIHLKKPCTNLILKVIYHPLYGMNNSLYGVIVTLSEGHMIANHPI